MVYLAAIVGVLLISVLIAPFFHGPGGLLQASSSINSPEQLQALKKAVLQRYLADEAAFAGGSLSRLAWDKRKAFLINRYIDTARRLDYLEGVAKQTTVAGSEPKPRATGEAGS